MIDEFLKDSFPKRPYWWAKETFPAAIPCPVSLFVHFFHDRIVRETDPFRTIFNEKIIRWETLVIFCVSWFMVATWGCRSVIVPDLTIDLIQRELGEITLFRDITSYRIISMMRETNQKAKEYPELLNRIVVTDEKNLRFFVGQIKGSISDYLLDSHFLHSLRLTGQIKFTNYGRQLFYLDPKRRNLKLAAREKLIREKRVGNPLQFKLTLENLMSIPDV